MQIILNILVLFTYLGHIVTMVAYSADVLILKKLFYEFLLFGLLFILISLFFYKGSLAYDKKYIFIGFLFFTYSIILTILSLSAGLSIFSIVYSLKEWILPLVFLFVLISLFKRLNYRQDFLFFITKLFIVLNLLYAGFQIFLGFENFSNLLFGPPPTGVYDYVQLDTGIRFSSFGNIFRPIGFFASCQEYGVISLLMLIILIELSEKSYRPWKSPFVYLAILNIILSTSRASILGLAVYLFFKYKSYKQFRISKKNLSMQILFSSVISLTAIILLAGNLMFLSIASVTDRFFNVWPYLFSKINEGGIMAWLTGLGLGSAGAASKIINVFDNTLIYVDSTPIYIILIAGLLGLLLYTGILYKIGKHHFHLIAPLFAIGIVSNIITMDSFIYLYFLILAIIGRSSEKQKQCD